jgi:uncharacterized SAM-binding protein YcdF (DUF218 family)
VLSLVSPISFKIRAETAAHLSRGFALCGGLLLLLEPLAHLRGGMDLHPWWSWTAPDVSPLVLLSTEFIAGAVLVLHGFFPFSGPIRRRVTQLTLAFLIFACAIDSCAYYCDLLAHRFTSGFPFPLTFLIGLLLSWVYRSRHAAACAGKGRRGLVVALGFLVSGLAFPLGQMLCQGMADHRYPADAAVVFGARVYSRGRLSNALEDRVRTGVELYKQGIVPLLIMSGGPGDDAIDEPEAMRRHAVVLGVKPSAILMDHGGVSTLATVHNTSNVFRSRGIQRVLAVSHFYHLPRIAMTYRAAGFPVHTVPAPQARILRPLPKLLLREIGGLWLQYLRAGVGDVDKVYVRSVRAAHSPPRRLH